MKRGLAILSAALLLLLPSCGAKQANKPQAAAQRAETAPVKNTGTFTFTAESFPRMGGSPANLPMGEAVAATVLGVSREKADEAISFSNSTTDCYKGLVDGTFDILIVYEPGEKAKAYIGEKQTVLEARPIGTDALAFVCSKKNKVKSLTLDQIKGIYSGKIKKWKEVGGKNEDILAYQCGKSTGSQALFNKLVGLGDKLMGAPVDLLLSSTDGLRETVAQYEGSENALGYTIYRRLAAGEDDRFTTSKILEVDGVTPSNETIKSGKYPLTDDFFVVIRKDAPQDSPQRILYNWICSAQGKALIEQEYYTAK
ncbi:MAG: substrate-binding domain-containing protein [Clostridia bacterium]|nr:substrate-binding domain-containing protein [Clostridia bacterium]